MTTARLTDLVFWPLLTLAALAQAAGLVLIGAEFLVLDPAHTATFNLAAYAVLATTSLAGLAVAGRIALRAAAAGRRLSAIARHARRPPAQLLAAAVPLGLSGRVDCVTAAEAFAVTHRLLRPRILLSTAALATLGNGAVLSAAVACCLTLTTTAAMPHDHQAAADRTPHWSAD